VEASAPISLERFARVSAQLVDAGGVSAEVLLRDGDALRDWLLQQFGLPKRLLTGEPMTEGEWLTSTDPLAMLDYLLVEPASHGGRFRCPRPGVTDRKIRLFACACARQVWHLLTDDEPCERCGGRGSYRHQQPAASNEKTPCPNCGGTGRVNRSCRAVEVAERFADGLATAEELARCRNDSWSMAHNESLANGSAAPAFTAVWALCCEQISWEDVLRAGIPAVQADLLRDVFGNLWRPVRVGEPVPVGGNMGLPPDPGIYVAPAVLAYGGGLVRQLAEAAYQKRTEEWVCPHCLRGSVGTDRGDDTCEACGGNYYRPPGLLDPVRLAPLADALEEAGCSDLPCVKCEGSGLEMAAYIGGAYFPDGKGREQKRVCRGGCKGSGRVPHPLLIHLRSSGPHVIGCWVVDLLLGKS
jgi:hypothetical protein